MTDLAVAIALVFVIEGLLWAAFPERMKALAAQAVELPTSLLRQGAILAMALGVFLVWLLRS